MPVSEARRRQLAQVLEQERSKGVRHHHRAPSRFRETLGDTHKTVPPEYFGPSPDLVPPHFTGSKDYLTLLRTSRASRSSRMMQQAAAAGPSSQEQQVEYRSVFQPRPEQQAACSRAKELRAAVANSEWALLDTLEATLCNDEKDQRRKGKARAAAELRAALDAQVIEKQQREQQQALTELSHEDVLQRDVQAARERDVVKRQQQRDSNIRLKHDRLASIQTARQIKQQELESKVQAEARMLDSIRLQLHQQKAAARAKAAALKQQALEVKAENEAKLRARREAEAEQKAIDEAMMKERIRLEEEEGRRRKEAQAAFKAKVQERVSGVSDQVLFAQLMKLQAEARLIDKYQEQQVHKDGAKEQQLRLKRERLRQELLHARQEFLELKQRRAAEDAQVAAAVQEEAAAAHRARLEEHERRMTLVRTRAAENRRALETQIRDNDLSYVDQEVGMTAAERQINHKLLHQAVKVVGSKPKKLLTLW